MKASITERLESWARWRFAEHGGHAAGISRTGQICEAMRRNSGTIQRRATGLASAMDEADAMLIDRKIGALPDKMLLLLWWHYVKRAAPGIICRKVGIPHRPASAFTTLLAAAHAEISSILDIN